METLTIRGCSDDLIVVESDGISEEFSAWDSGESTHRRVCVSDGTVLDVVYDEDGTWRFVPVVLAETTVYANKQAPAGDNSDVVTLESHVPFRWVVIGRANDFVRREKAPRA